MHRKLIFCYGNFKPTMYLFCFDDNTLLVIKSIVNSAPRLVCLKTFEFFWQFYIKIMRSSLLHHYLQFCTDLKILSFQLEWFNLHKFPHEISGKFSIICQHLLIKVVIWSMQHRAIYDIATHYSRWAW